VGRGVGVGGAWGGARGSFLQSVSGRTCLWWECEAWHETDRDGVGLW
jgi:hypothetical protein